MDYMKAVPNKFQSNQVIVRFNLIILLFQGGLVMSYDAVNQMIAQYQSIDVDGNHIEQRVIIDYKQVGSLTF